MSSLNSPQPYLAVTLPSTTEVMMGWTIGIASDGNKAASVQINAVSGGRILFPGSGASVSSASLAEGNYELLVFQFDGSNFRVVQTTPATATLLGDHRQCAGDQSLGLSGGEQLCGLARRQRNRALQLQHADRLADRDFAFDDRDRDRLDDGLCYRNGKTMILEVNSTSGGRILYPAEGRHAGDAITLAPVNYEFLALQFDGSNFRIVSITPRSAAALGMLGHQITTGAAPMVASGPGDCGTSPGIGGNDSAGRVTVGASNGGRCTITFATPWPNPPVCSAFDETTESLVRPVAASTSSVAFAGALTAGDRLVYHCVGYQ